MKAKTWRNLTPLHRKSPPSHVKVASQMTSLRAYTKITCSQPSPAQAEGGGG